MIVVAHNLMAMNADRQFNITGKKKAKNVEKLSSGYKINRAADDAAGLSISEKMRHQIRGLHQAMSNIEDGVNFCKVADGALNEVHNILGRIGELAVQAANDVNDEEDRKAIDNEVQELKGEMKKIFHDTQFNGKHYWIQPYIPEVSGRPDDIKVFQSDTSSTLSPSADTNGYGGVIVNGVRYSWDDLGIAVDSEGYLSEADNGEGIKDYTGNEIFQWRSSPSDIDENGNTVLSRDVVPNIRRLYEWSADGTGIYVNNVLAITKEDLLDNPLGSTSEGITYGFDYHGMHVEFIVPNEDVGDWHAISNGINGKADDGFDSDATWEAYPITPYETDSVSLGGYNTVYISDGWKDNVTDIPDYYYFDLLRNNNSIDTSQNSDYKNDYETNISDGDGDNHSDGFMLKHKGLNPDDHEQMKWEDFYDNTIASNSSIESNGGYPIVDWGTKYSDPYKKPDNDVDDITLNEAATYKYTDTYKYDDGSATEISFSFNMIDETSLENMQEEIKNAKVNTNISCKVMTKADDGVAKVGNVTVGYLSVLNNTMDYGLQRDSNKTFGEGTEISSVPFKFKYSISTTDVNAASFTISYEMYKYDDGATTFDPDNGYTDSNKMFSTSFTIKKSDIISLAEKGYYEDWDEKGRLHRHYSIDINLSSDDYVSPYYSNETNEFSLKMSLYVPNVYAVVPIDEEYKDDEAKKNDSDFLAVKKKLFKVEHPECFEEDVDGIITDNIKTEADDTWNKYSTYDFADSIHSYTNLYDGTYTYSTDEGTYNVDLTKAEAEVIKNLYNYSENKRQNDYETKINKQYEKVFDMLKNP